LAIKITTNRTVTLPFVLHGCESWSHTLKEEHGQRVFENRVLRKILGGDRHEVAGDWGILHSELYDLYSSPNIFG